VDGARDIGVVGLRDGDAVDGERAALHVHLLHEPLFAPVVPAEDLHGVPLDDPEVPLPVLLPIIIGVVSDICIYILEILNSTPL
jgi:hypothetical protein